MEKHTFTNTTVTLKKQAKQQILCLRNDVSVELNSKSKKGEKNNCGPFTVGQLRNISMHELYNHCYMFVFHQKISELLIHLYFVLNCTATLLYCSNERIIIQNVVASL